METQQTAKTVRLNGEQMLTAAFGTQCGLNADWSVSAWRVSGELYAGTFITDDEDGCYSLVRSTQDADEMHAIETIETVVADELPALISRFANA